MPAVAALGTIDVIAVAFVMLLLLYALFPIYEPLIAGALSQVPLIGQWISNQAISLLWAAWRWVSDRVNAGVAPIADALNNVYTSLAYWSEAATWGAEQLLGALIRTTYIGLASVAKVAEERLGITASNLQSNINASEARSHGELATTASNLQGNINDSEARSHGELGVTAANLQANINAAEARGAALTGQVASDLQANINASERALRALVGVTAGGIEADIAAEHAAAAGLIDQVARQLGADIGLTGQRARDYTDARTDAVAGAAALETAAVATGLAELERSPCIQRCDVLGDLGNGLQALEDAGLAVALVALTGAFVHDGPSTARALWSDLGGPVRDITATARQVVGV